MQYYEKEFTLWDRFTVQGELTLQQFLDYFQVSGFSLSPQSLTRIGLLSFKSFFESNPWVLWPALSSVFSLCVCVWYSTIKTFDLHTDN